MAPRMAVGNDDNDFRSWKARSHRWGRIPRTCLPIAEAGAIARYTHARRHWNWMAVEKQIQHHRPLRVKKIETTRRDQQPARAAAKVIARSAVVILSAGTIA